MTLWVGSELRATLRRGDVVGKFQTRATPVCICPERGGGPRGGGPRGGGPRGGGPRGARTARRRTARQRTTRQRTTRRQNARRRSARRPERAEEKRGARTARRAHHAESERAAADHPAADPRDVQNTRSADHAVDTASDGRAAKFGTAGRLVQPCTVPGPRAGTGPGRRCRNASCGPCSCRSRVRMSRTRARTSPRTGCAGTAGVAGRRVEAGCAGGRHAPPHGGGWCAWPTRSATR